MTASVENALRSLAGLSVGDAFGQSFYTYSATLLATRSLPPGPWPWTDDSHMALSIVEVLRQHSCIDQDALARAFARRFQEDPHRGYARGASRLLSRLMQGEDWRDVAPTIFPGGSYGNGAAMRAAPIGGFFAGDPGRAAADAQLSAVVTHAHPEGQAGAMAVAAAAAIASCGEPAKGRGFVQSILPFVPPGPTRDKVEIALDVPGEGHREAVLRLGTGMNVSAQDTVPYCLWCAAYHLDDFAEAMWWTAAGMGDCDTTCAIVGGIVALVAAVPPEWVARREALPEGYDFGGGV